MNQIVSRIAGKDELSIALNLLKEASLWLKREGVDYWQSWINPSLLSFPLLKETIAQDIGF